jgi:predicted transposase YdaD
MEVFVKDDAYNDKFPKTSESKHRYKETEGGLDVMCDIMEKLTTEAKAEGKAEGRTEGKIETLVGLVKDGIITITEAAKRANVTETVIKDKMKSFQ